MIKISPLQKIKKEIEIPSDKSISHRALMISSLSKGKTRIRNFLQSDDTLITLNCFKKLNVGITYKKKDKEVIINSGGSYFDAPKRVNLYSGESGTTIRLISGILAGQRFISCLSAAPSLEKRPMKRITFPLRLMGADIQSREKAGNEYPPLSIKPVKGLHSIIYKTPVASAQIKSAIIFASLFSKGITKIKEPFISRDHTERMLKFFGAKLKKQSGYILVEKSKLKTPGEILIPGDFSSAAFFVVLGLILKNSELRVKNVGLNSTRTGLIPALKSMGAKIRILHKNRSYFEPYGDILIESSSLKGITIKQEDIPLMIDEIPLLMICACFARGTTKIYGLKELRVKETDRITSMVYNLKKAGQDIETKSYKSGKETNWMVKIKGGERIRPAEFKSFSDHRTAMSLIIFALASEKGGEIDDIECTNKSFPGFISIVDSL